jgi:uncharacterized repeat protein (TIGR02543 family)
MIKNILILFIIAMLSLSLGLLTGCPTDPEEEGTIFPGGKEIIDTGDEETTGSEGEEITDPEDEETTDPGEEETIFTVTFNNGHDDNTGYTNADPATATTSEGETVLLPATKPTRTGYIFDGWYTEEDGEEMDFTETTPITANITVYARWVRGSIVMFDKNDGSSGEDAIYATENILFPVTTVETLTPPIRTGYTFNGWNTQADGFGNAFTIGIAGTSVTESIRVYAQWSGNTYTVTFNSNYYVFNATQTAGNRGVTTTVSTQTLTYPNTLGTAPVRDGYDFDGWNSATDGTGTDFDTTTPIAGSITVYAKWTPKSTSKNIKYGTPTINGDTIDPLWTGAVEYPIDKVHELSNLTSSVSTYRSTSADTNGSKYSYGIAKALWDDNGLWVFVRVADDRLTTRTTDQGSNSYTTTLGPDRHDSVEVLINEATTATGLDISQTAYEVDDNRIGGLYRVAAQGQKSTHSDPAGAEITTSVRFLIPANSPLAVDGQAGYGIIFQAPWVAKDAYPVGNGKKFGLELQINACRGSGGSFTDGGANGRQGVMVWNNNAINNAGSLTTGIATGVTGVTNVPTVTGNVTNYAEMILIGKP